MEDVNSLFLHCVVAWEMWFMIYSIFDVSWVMPEWMQEMLACCKGWLDRRCNGEIWQADLLCLMWCL